MDSCAFFKRVREEVCSVKPYILSFFAAAIATTITAVLTNDIPDTPSRAAAFAGFYAFFFVSEVLLEARKGPNP